MDQYLICDTGTLLSLWMVANDFSFLKVKKFHFLISPLIQAELRQFSKHQDVLGKYAEEILRGKVIVKEVEGIEELKTVLGVSGRRRITEADLSMFLLAKNEQRPLFTDDFSVLIHLPSFFREENVFHGLALVTHLLSSRLTTAEIYNYIFNRFIPQRWNKITEQRLVDIETIINDVLE